MFILSETKTNRCQNTPIIRFIFSPILTDQNIREKGKRDLLKRKGASEKVN